APQRFPVRIGVFAILALAVVLVLIERLYRVFEVELSGGILRLITSSGVAVRADQETVYFGLTGNTPLGLRMTPECSSVFLLLPLLLVTAVMLALRPANARRLFFSLAVSSFAVLAVNQLRVLMIVGLVNWFGPDTGYYWGHTLLGSMISVLGGATALVLFVWLATRKGRR